MDPEIPAKIPVPPSAPPPTVTPTNAWYGNPTVTPTQHVSSNFGANLGKILLMIALLVAGCTILYFVAAHYVKSSPSAVTDPTPTATPISTVTPTTPVATAPVAVTTANTTPSGTPVCPTADPAVKSENSHQIIASVDQTGGVISTTRNGTTFYSYWDNTNPIVVDANCNQISLNSLEPGENVNLYYSTPDLQNLLYVQLAPIN